MVSLVTVLSIQENGAEVTVGKGGNGKYGFEIYSIISEKYRPQLSSELIYNSEEEAKESGEKILDKIKKLDLNAKRKELSNLVDGSRFSKKEE